MGVYQINEIFYSLQGEGFWSGTPAVFVRFSGCNLKCPFCDTDHFSHKEYTTLQLLDEIDRFASNFVVLTGGEPSLFVDEELICALHERGKYIAMETNGTRMLPSGIDWITLSPKDSFLEKASVVLKSADEVKVVFDGNNMEQIGHYSSFDARYYFLQPCDTGNKQDVRRITSEAMEFCLENPKWRLSLQIHKIVGFK